MAGKGIVCIGKHIRKQRILLPELTQIGSSIPFVSIAGKMIGTQRIKGDEDDVTVLTHRLPSYLTHQEVPQRRIIDNLNGEDDD